MKKKLLASLLITFGLVASAHAQLIDNNTPIPDDVVLTNFNGAGLDWVYAGPIAPHEFGPGNIQPASYRADEGWRVATPAEWSLRPSWDDFIAPGNPGGIVSPSPGFSDHSAYIFASEYWGNFSHVDTNDFAEGRVTDGLNGCLDCGVPETIYVRNLITPPIPEPETYAMLVAGLGLLGAIARRRRSAGIGIS